MKGHTTTLLKYLVLITSITLSQTSCSLFDDDEPGIPAPASCSPEDYNQYVYDVMKRFYYWYDEVDPTNQIDPKDTIAYPTPHDLVKALRYEPFDRFSGVSNATTHNQFIGEGVFLGTGLRLLTDEITGDLMIAYSFTGSSAYDNGIRRGDRIVEVNGYAANDLTGDDWIAAWGPSEVGVQVDLLVHHAGDPTQEETIQVTKSLVSINTTQYSTVIDAGANKVGYLHFTNFLSTAVEHLETQFSTFKQNNINELIVDLRYNGGGSIKTARTLGSLIGGEKTAGSLFTKLIFNNKPNGYDGYSERFNFLSEISNSLNLNRVVFITTGDSCSASELLINSFIPATDIEVVVIGSTTCGKPVGFKPQIHCGKALSFVNFEIKNAANQGGYFDGISAGYSGLGAFCDAEDDITSPLGDSNELSVASALSYIDSGQCSVNKNKSGMRLKSGNGSGNQYSIIESMY